jgi:hypothetical protein
MYSKLYTSKYKMNIFILHLNPKTCAQMHLDKHVVKMILETCQMLCAVWHVTDPNHEIYTPPYKLAHKNHPCSIWVRESLSNYKWLCELGLELCLEYTYRYGKTHASEKHIRVLAEQTPPIPDLGFTKPAQAMPDMYKDKDPVEAYRHYYFFEKYNIHSWKGKINGRETPEWITDFQKMFD